ncbi:MAG: hypothetical protein N2316_10105 [Spirochaetes bacterium]|nr:hypothetical protein [Spirochaetota bacterium]
MMKNTICAVLACTFFLITTSLAQEQQEQLAEVLVLPFANETQKKEYEWLSKNIPNAIVDSMKEKFRFILMTRDRFEEIVLLSKTKELVLFRPHTDEREIVKISKVVNADIIIYGKYTYSKEEKTIMVNAHIYHRSRGKTTGTIDMITPVTSEMFKLVDKVADSVIEHIAVIAKEDAEAAQKAGQQTARDIKQGGEKEEKITLVKREFHEKKAFRFFAGISYGGGLGYFYDISHPGFGAMLGIANHEQNFWHYGILFSALTLQQQDQTGKNIIKSYLFMPCTLEGGINIRTDFFTTIQTAIGGGISVDSINVGDETVFINNLPLRSKTNDRLWYVNPTASIALRMPISLGSLCIMPFIHVFGYTGTTILNEREYGFLGVGGISLLW